MARRTAAKSTSPHKVRMGAYPFAALLTLNRDRTVASDQVCRSSHDQRGHAPKPRLRRYLRYGARNARARGMFAHTGSPRRARRAASALVSQWRDAHCTASPIATTVATARSSVSPSDAP